MSTRCQIKLKTDDKEFDVSESNIRIYKHSDGYPEGVIPNLLPIVQNFNKKRGCRDGAYLLCQIVRHWAVMDHKESIAALNDKEQLKIDDKLKSKWKDCGETFLWEQDVLGWGLDCDDHGDIEYLYEIDSKGNIYINGKKQSEAQLKKYCK